MYTEDIADLKHLTSPNRPGIVQVRAIPKEQVTHLRSFTDFISDPEPGSYPLSDYGLFPFINKWITLSGGTGSWLNISKDFAVQMLMTETEKPNVQLKTYQYKILFDLGNDDYTTRGKIIQAYSRREWILIVNEISGAVRLIGSMERGADFSSQLTTGNAIKGPVNQYTCGFTWETGPEPAFYIAS